MQYETMIWNFDLLVYFENKDANWCILTLLKPMSVRMTFFMLWIRGIINENCEYQLYCNPTPPQPSICNTDFELSVFRLLKMMICTGVRAYAQLRADHGGQFCSVICFRDHRSEITHIVKTDNLLKTQLIVWNKCSFSCHLKETNDKTKKQFYESTNEKLKL